MFIQVDFYKFTGKWYANGIVEIPDDCYLHSDSFKQEIVNNQNILIDGFSGYYIVVSDTHANYLDPKYNRFYNRLFTPQEFEGIKKMKYEKANM